MIHFLQSIFKWLLPFLLKIGFWLCYSVYDIDSEHVKTNWNIAIERTGVVIEKLEAGSFLQFYPTLQSQLAEWKKLRGKSFYTVIKKQFLEVIENLWMLLMFLKTADYEKLTKIVKTSNYKFVLRYPFRDLFRQFWCPADGT